MPDPSAVPNFTPDIEKSRQSLSDADWSNLCESGLSKKTIALRGYRTTKAAVELEEKGYGRQQRRAGLFVPFYHWDKGQPVEVFSQVRPHKPRERKKKLVKYENPGGIQLQLDMLHCAPDTKGAIWIVEGIKKADALAQVVPAEDGVVGMVGCWGWKIAGKAQIRQPLADMLKGREVVLALDADIGSNSNVLWAARKFYEIARETDAGVRVLNLSAVATGTEGIDDYLAQGGELADIPFVSERDLELMPRIYNDTTYDIVDEALASLGLEFREIVRGGHHQVIYKGDDPDLVPEEMTEWTSASRKVACSLQRVLERKFRLERKDGIRPFKLARDRVQDMVREFCFRNSLDLFIEYLESLPPWDQQHRIDMILTDYFEADNNRLNQWASRYPFIGAVERAYKPGELHRAFPILYGSEDLGKSGFFRHILPEHLQLGGFNDQVNLDDSPQRQCEQISEAIVVELSELVGIRKAEIENLKQFLTRTTDEIRHAYDESITREKRRFVIVGTTNDPAPLPNDPKGNTRFVVVACKTGFNVESTCAQHRDQWWAEALHRFRQGEEANIPRDLRPEQKEHLEQYRNRNEVIEDAIEAWVSIPENRDPTVRFKMIEIAEQSGIIDRATSDNNTQTLKLNRSVQIEIAAALKGQGFVKQAGKNYGWHWAGR